MGASKIQLSRADLEAALGLVRRIESVPDLPSFQSEALTELRRLVPCDLAGYNEIDPAHGTAVVGQDPTGFLSMGQMQAFRRHMDQHPVLAHVTRTQDRTPLRISDLISRRQLHRLDLYDGVFRPSGLESQIVLTLDAPAPVTIGISLNRTTRDFRDRDRNLLALLRPHLSAARRNAELRQLHLASEHLPDGAPGVALISAAGPLLATNRLAEQLLSRYFGGSSRPSYLPDDIGRWVAQQRRWRAGDRPQVASGELRIEADPGTLIIHLLPGRRPAEPDALLLSERRPALDPGSLKALGLTSREVEVLSLAGAGLRNAGIARELVISPLTVKKHLENTYRKLGVGGRAAALARARDASQADAAFG